MESSFKKAYDRNVYPDGSIEITYKAKRFSPSATVATTLFGMFILFPASCAVTLPIAAIFNGPRDDLADTNMFLWNILAMVLYFTIAYFAVNTKVSLTIKPYEGLLFGANKLPFKEIQNIGTINHPVLNGKAGSACVYAESHGKQILVTKFIPLSLASAIVNEIKPVSGITWVDA